MQDTDDFAMEAPARPRDARGDAARWLPVAWAATRTGAGAGFVGGAGCALAYFAENAAEGLDWAPLAGRFLTFTTFMGAAFAVLTEVAVVAAGRARSSRVVAATLAGAVSGIPSGMIGGGYFGALPAPFVPATATAALFLLCGSWVAFACAARARRRAGLRGLAAVLPPACCALACAAVLGVSALALAETLGQPSVIGVLRSFQSIGLAWLGAVVGMLVGFVLGLELGVVSWLTVQSRRR